MTEKKKILIVNDDEDTIGLLTDFCENLHYQVKTLKDCTLVVSHAIEWRPELILLDLEMNNSEGFDVLTGLRTHPDTKNIPILNFTGGFRELYKFLGNFLPASCC